MCMDGKVSVMLMPCTCFRLCVKCSEDLKRREKPCPWCDAQVKQHLLVRR